MSTQIPESITIPTMRTEGETVEERLDPFIASNTLPARYLNKDESGDVVETPAELFNRVAKNVALAEVVYEAENQGKEITATPEQIKESHPRRGELAAEAFGYDNRKCSSIDEVPDDIESAREFLLDTEIKLTEDNISKFSYDTVVPELNSEDHQEIIEHVESIKDEFEDLMSHLGWMPNSPTLMNAGAELQQLSACFVISPDDDIDDIHDTEREAAKVFQSGGGLGYGFWKLRPYGDQVGSTGGIASGPVTFMRTYDQMCETIAQGGMRRGAQMGVLKVTHPDIIQFIHAKNKDVSLAHTLLLNDPDDPTHDSVTEAIDEARGLINENGKVPKHLRNAVEGHLSNFNISIGATSEFMEAVKNDEKYELINPRTGEQHIATEGTKELYERFDLGDEVTIGEPLSLPAAEVYERIVEGAYENGEPGLLFLDRANEEHSFPVESSDGPDHSEHEILATNPCGEQFLEEYEACNLGHINLSTIVAQTPEYQDYNSTFWKKIPPTSGPTAQDFRAFTDQRRDNGYNGPKDDPKHIAQFLNQAIDWSILNRRIDLGTRFLENVCTMSDFPVAKIEQTVKRNRKIGLGIMGLAQLFIQLGLRYGSPEANEATEQLMMYINRRSKAKSQELAVDQDRGSFETHEESKYANPMEHQNWFEHHTGERATKWTEGYPIRNHNTTTIAPTGTTSQIARTTGGCEPIFSVVNLRRSSGDVQEGQYVEFDDYFARTLRENDVDPDVVKEEATSQMVDEDKEYTGIDGLSTVPDALADIFIVKDDLSEQDHAGIQCAAQQGVDSSISKTINAPNDATIEDTKDVFMQVYDNGGKGVTYYRDGSRTKQIKTTRKQNQSFADANGDIETAEIVEILETEDGSPDTETVLEVIEELYEGANNFIEDQEVRTHLSAYIERVTDIIPESELEAGFAVERPRPKTLHGINTKIDTGFDAVYVNINLDENGDPFEVFCKTGQSGGLYNSFAEALGKTVSIAIRSGVEPREIADTLTDIRAPKPVYDNGDLIKSIPDAIGTALNRYLDGNLNPNTNQQRIEDITTTAQATKVEAGSMAELSNGTSNPGESADIDQKENGKSSADVQDLVEKGESPVCPECGQMTLYFSEGCKHCESCGWSEC